MLLFSSTTTGYRSTHGSCGLKNGARDDGAWDDGARDDEAWDDGARDDGAWDDGARDDGAMVPQGFYQTDKRVVALMIEVRRDLYMDECNIEKLDGFDAVRRRMRSVILEIINLV